MSCKLRDLCARGKALPNQTDSSPQGGKALPRLRYLPTYWILGRLCHRTAALYCDLIRSIKEEVLQTYHARVDVYIVRSSALLMRARGDKVFWDIHACAEYAAFGYPGYPMNL